MKQKSEELAESIMSILLERRPTYFLSKKPNHKDFIIKEDFSYESERLFKEELQSAKNKVISFMHEDVDELSRIHFLLDAYINKETLFGFLDIIYGECPYIINPVVSPIIDIPLNMATFFRVESFDDVNSYVRNLSLIPGVIDSVRRKFEYDLSQQWSTPIDIVDSSIHVINNFLGKDPRENILYKSLMASLGVLDNQRQVGELVKKAEEILASEIYGAYNRLILSLKKTTASKSYANVNLKVNDKKFYEKAILSQGTKYKSPETIHEFGIKEVRMLHSKELFQKFRELPKLEELLFSKNESLDQAILNHANKLVEKYVQNLKKFFTAFKVPAINIKPIPSYLEDSSALGVYIPSCEEGGQASLLLNLKFLKVLPYDFLELLIAHEIVPGHHLQFSIANSMNLNSLVKINNINGFVEGWATYSEKLIDTIMLQENIGNYKCVLQYSELLRAVRLVVDTGIHYKDWTKEKAVDYIMSTMEMTEAAAKSEVIRYASVPAQALGYYLGMKEIENLKGNAKVIQEFHYNLLKNGAIAFPYLNKEADVD